ncbi:MAG: 3-methyl-2-oxobutanoate hydroxymethyltransferase [Nitrospinota bacterium]|nr:3-methyl-2-oxobutanoate hydroxymethyltransferase [Nitrospinota bacterium]
MDKVTAVSLIEQKKEGRKITALTAYDAPFAKLMDEAGIDVILVGDSVGMTVLGREDTLSVTMEEMIHHTRAVSSVVKRAMVVADMPFMSFQVSPQKALENAGRLIKEGRAHGVKLEGGKIMADTIRAIVNAGIPVMGHVGLTPQSVHQLGGYKVQGKKFDSARQILADSRGVEKAGAFSIVLEAIPADLAQAVTEELHIPTVGIGAGPHCDGQILVMQDMLGLSERKAKFVKEFVNIRKIARDAFTAYVDEVRGSAFPSEEHSYKPSKTKLKVVGDEEKKRG